MNVSPVTHALNGKVLVFDSGLGGLSVVRAIRTLAPGLCIDYAADTGFFPYGDKPDAVLQTRLPVLARSLVQAAQPDVFIIACNTASTLALAAVRQAVDIPVVGTVPAIKPTAIRSQTEVIGLLATPATIRCAYTEKLIEKFARKTRVITHGSVELVRLAERHIVGDVVAREAFRAAQAPLFEAPGGRDIDLVVLACTHFPLIHDQLAMTTPHPVAFIDSGMAIARQTIRVLPSPPQSGRSCPAGHQQTGGQLWLTRTPRADHRLVGVCRDFGFTKVCRPKFSSLPA